MSKQFWGVIIVVIGLLIGLAVFTGKSSAPSSSAGQPTNHVRGEGAKKVTLVEYGDFQCPFCGQYYPTMEQIFEQYKGDVTFQFRHFPLTNLHQNAFAAARAAEAAGLQGKFFDMYGILYQNQQSWSTTNAPQSTFEQYATRLGLDLTKFKADYASPKVNDAINADMAAGNKLNVQGTPTFFLDGKQVTINNTVDAFKKALDAEIAKKTAASPAPTSTTAPATDTTGTGTPAAGQSAQ